MRDKRLISRCESLILWELLKQQFLNKLWEKPISLQLAQSSSYTVQNYQYFSFNKQYKLIQNILVM